MWLPAGGRGAGHQISRKQQDFLHTASTQQAGGGARWKLTWLPAAGAELVPLTLVDFGYLVTKRKLEDEDGPFQDFVNEHTARAHCRVCEASGERVLL